MIDANTFTDSIKNTTLFPAPVIEMLRTKKYFNLWVPKAFNGLESNLSDGLNILFDLAKTDGTLGWTVTLCAGANYFIGNMSAIAQETIFRNKLPILGGSGGKWGTAECVDNNYILNGTWKYATGANYLSHFTLNAILTKDNQPIMDENGCEQFLSFVIPKEAVTIIDDWDRMGLKATATNSFSIDNYVVGKEYTFRYNHFELPQLIFKIPFQIFADFTLWVNYAGMFAHFAAEVLSLKGEALARPLNDLGIYNVQQFNELVAQVCQLLENSEPIPDILSQQIFEFCSNSVAKMAQTIIQTWPHLGTKAASEKEQVNVIFRDFFTATQHHNFIRQQP